MSTIAKKNRTIIVTVKLGGMLREHKSSFPGYLGGGKWRIPEETTIKALIELLTLSEELAGIVFVNGSRVQKDWMVQEGDMVEIFQPLSGG